MMRLLRPHSWIGAGLTDVKEETLEQAAELLMLRRDTFRIIDDTGPSVDEQDASSERSAQADLIDEEKASQVSSPKPEQVSECKGAESQKQPATQPKCTFSGEVPVDLQQFLDSGIRLVECPDCTSTSALSPHKGILHFKPHKRRKTRSLSIEPRWARREMIWAVMNK
jgi:hypothetical protein